MVVRRLGKQPWKRRPDLLRQCAMPDWTILHLAFLPDTGTASGSDTQPYTLNNNKLAATPPTRQPTFDLLHYRRYVQRKSLPFPQTSQFRESQQRLLSLLLHCQLPGTQTNIVQLIALALAFARRNSFIALPDKTRARFPRHYTTR
jgi:hypothetical protein